MANGRTATRRSAGFTESAIVRCAVGSLICLCLWVWPFLCRTNTLCFAMLPWAPPFSLASTVITEAIIVTDREAVTEVVYAIADCVQLND